MSSPLGAIGSRQPFQHRPRDVRLLPITDSRRTRLDVSSVPAGDFRSALFNYFIGKPLELLRHIEAQRLGGGQINDEFVFCWGLHREIDRFFTFENAIGICRC